MPSEGQAVEVPEELHLDMTIGELLHPDPEEGAQVADKAGGACERKRVMEESWVEREGRSEGSEKSIW